MVEILQLAVDSARQILEVHQVAVNLNPVANWDAGISKFSLSEKIERNAKLQTQLIEDLLDISRIIPGKLTLNPCPVNLISMVEAAVNTVGLAADARSIDVRLAIVDLDLETAEFCQPGGVSGDRESELNPRFLVSGDPGRLQLRSLCRMFWSAISECRRKMVIRC